MHDEGDCRQIEQKLNEWARGIRIRNVTVSCALRRDNDSFLIDMESLTVRGRAVLTGAMYDRGDWLDAVVEELSQG
jgi:hypothetical protein